MRNLPTYLVLPLLAMLLTIYSCKGEGSSQQSTEAGQTHASASSSSDSAVAATPFSADSAYAYIAAQVAFGPRVPNTEGHRQCADYLAVHLERMGLQVTRQSATLRAWDGTPLAATNIIGEYRPDAPQRVLLFAHWDTRPIADHDPNPHRRQQPIDGADDGASGTAVLMELARLLQEHPLRHIGVDIILFDAEDYGLPHDHSYEGDSSETWALGTQYWGQNPHRPDYRADFGILLDMVGAKDATFYREYFSTQADGQLVSRIWSTARKLGYAALFRNQDGGAVTDDHFYVMKYRRFPCVDIIHSNPTSENGFGKHWHTHDDNLDNISRTTLNAVGHTVWQVLQDYDQLVGQEQ